jgi:type I restriction enzyme, S subunit
MTAALTSHSELVEKSQLLPAGWTRTTIGQVTELVTKGSSPNWQGFDYCTDGIPFVRSQNVGWGSLDLSDVAHLPTAFNKKEKKSVLKTDDVLLNIVGASIGRACLATPDVEGGNVNQAVAVIRVKSGLLSPKFLSWFLISPTTQQRIHAEKVDVARANFSLEDTRNLDIALPPLPEQRRIVAEIEKQLTRLEAGVTALRRVQANLNRYRAAVLKAACEGKLVVRTKAESGKKFENAEQLLQRILKQRREKWIGNGKYKEPATPDATGLSKLPEGWCWATMPQIGELSRGKSRHRPRDDTRLYGGPYPFIQTGDIRKSGGTIREHTQTYSEFGLQQSRLWPEGTLCITIAANIAETGILQFTSCFPDSVVGFIHDGNRATTRYVEFFIRTAKEKLAQFAPATAQKNINLDVLQKVAIPFPPLAEQERIVAEVERRLSVVEELSALVESNLKRATRLRQSILQRAFEGKLCEFRIL